MNAIIENEAIRVQSISLLESWRNAWSWRSPWMPCSAAVRTEIWEMMPQPCCSLSAAL